jgi:hypothetical protein
LSIDVRCANDVLETLRVEAVDAFNSLSHGGLETGGILLGRQTEGSVEILGCQPLVCEHSTGPSFVLSEKDETALQAALAELKQGVLQPIGLYMMHSRRGFSPVETDRRIMDRYFPEPWEMALLLMPVKLGPTRAGFFVRSPGAEPAYLCTHELLLEAPEPNGKAEEPTRPSTLSAYRDDADKIPAPAAAVSMVPVSSAIDPAGPSILGLESVEPVFSYEPKHRRMNWWKLMATLALMILCGAIVATLWTRSRVVTPAPVSIHISDAGPNVRIEWDAAQQPIREATGAFLEIHDGESLAINLPITRDGLDSGSVVYVPQSEKLEVRLKLLRGNEPPIESAPYFFINPVMPAGSEPAAPSPAATPVDAPSVISNPVSQAKSEEPVPSPAVPTPTKENQQLSSQTPAPPPRAHVPVRLFRPPAKRPSARGNVVTQASLPDLPEIHTAQTPLSVPVESVPQIGVTPYSAPVAPRPVAAASLPAATNQTQPRSGRLIWTGDLRKSGLLSLSAAGASMGVLNGRLPGFPVKISVQPAELVAGGIAIFSSDQSRSGTSEPPSARNGWNVVVYKWDPKRTSEVTVIEPPGASNGWRQLVLRNGNHNISVLVVDWQREGGL